eukprot:gene19213-21137_t
MPDHATKKKGATGHGTSSSNKIPHVDEGNKASAIHENSENVGPGQALNEESDEIAANEMQQVAIKEVPKQPKDIMRSEPILTRLIVDGYEGEMDEEGFFESDGIAHFVGGHWYKGNFKHGFMDGKGVYCWADGIMYAGEFTCNKITGNGVYSWPDGSIYEGEVLEGFRHGKGTYRCGTCPSMYTGDWVEGKRHGKGILYFDEQCKTYYEGDWQNGRKHGHGTHKYKSGNIYEGQWLDNKRHGQGKMSWFDRGEQYDGSWVNGVQNGIGRYTWYSKRVTVSQYPIRNEYEGAFVNATRDGYGVFNYASGAKYAGEWKNNVKHGQGEFTFKNGSVYKGMFENDHIVEFPDLIPSRMTTPDITDAGIPVRSQTPVRMPSPTATAGVGSVDAVLDINLGEIFTRDKIDIDQQYVELTETTKTTLRYITPLKHVYKCYSSLGKAECNSDNTFVMNRIQFWRFLKDCDLHVLGRSLTEMDAAYHAVINNNNNETSQQEENDPHDPATQFYVKDFINALVHVAYLLFAEECGGGEKAPLISSCLVKLINEKVVPNACIIKGSVFADLDKTKEAMKYIDRCNDVFVYFSNDSRHRSRTNNSTTHAKSCCMRMRDFLLILKDLKLLNSNLSARKFIEILHCENQRVLEDHSYNLETEIVFLEFFETLVDCAEYFTLPEKLPHDLKGSMLSSLSSGRRTDNVQNILSLDVKSPTAIARSEEDVPLEAENANEFAQSPSIVDAPSPDKSITAAAEIASVAATEQQATEAVQSPTARSQQEVAKERKTSTASGHTRRDAHGGSKDGGGSSLTGSMRGKRRGTQDQIDFSAGGSTTNSTSRRDKMGSKEKDKSKNGASKSAKRVVIDDEVATTTAAPSIADQPESEAHSMVVRTTPAVDHEGFVSQSLADKPTESVTSPGKNQTSADEGNLINNNDSATVDNANAGDSPVLPIGSSHGVLSPDTTAIDDINEDHFQTWADHLNKFFNKHFFPAFERYKVVDNVIKEKAAKNDSKLKENNH